MAERARIQYVTIRCVFNKRVSARAAAAAVTDCIHGDFWPVADETEGAERFKVNGRARPVRVEKRRG